MKKLYIEPQLELMSIRLLADVLGPSQDTWKPEDEVQDETQSYFDPTEWEDI